MFSGRPFCLGLVDRRRNSQPRSLAIWSRLAVISPQVLQTNLLSTSIHSVVCCTTGRGSMGWRESINVLRGMVESPNCEFRKEQGVWKMRMTKAIRYYCLRVNCFSKRSMACSISVRSLLPSIFSIVPVRAMAETDTRVCDVSSMFKPTTSDSESC